MIASGYRVNNYTLEYRLGSGSSGDVWRASNGVHTVAIKFMNEALIANDPDGKHRASLETEIKALRRLHHPHVPALYDYDLEGERPYLMMQYIEGETYDRLIASGEMLRVPMERRLDILRVIASTINALHRKKIIHRDIKPSNISGLDIPYLLDFSIALMGEQTTRAQHHAGTSIYMPPPDEPFDEMGDNYSFGLVAYEMLFGHHAIFTPQTVGATVQETRQRARDHIRQQTWRKPSRIPPPELPGDIIGADLEALDTIFQKALDDRAGRYRDLVELVDALTAAIVIPANQPYLLNPLPPTLTAHEIPAQAYTTDHAFALDDIATQHDVHPLRPRLRPRDWLLTTSLISVIVWVVIIVLVLMIGNR